MSLACNRMVAATHLYQMVLSMFLSSDKSISGSRLAYPHGNEVNCKSRSLEQIVSGFRAPLPLINSLTSRRRCFASPFEARPTLKITLDFQPI